MRSKNNKKKRVKNPKCVKKLTQKNETNPKKKSEKRENARGQTGLDKNSLNSFNNCFSLPRALSGFSGGSLSVLNKTLLEQTLTHSETL